MKRTVIYTVLALALALSLCGCADTVYEDDVINTAPVISDNPMMTPDIEDGYVEDGDGIIGDEEHETKPYGNNTGHESGGNAHTSPSPAVTAKT